MAALAASTVVACRNLESPVQRVRTSNCDRETAAKLLKNTTRIYGPPPKHLGQDKPRFPRPDRPIPSVSETQFMSSPYSLQHSTVDVISPKLEIFLSYLDPDYHEFFTAHSIEGGNIMSPAKYYIYSPFPDFFFAGSTCNGLLLLQNPEWENLVWNPTTHEFKIFPKTFVKPPPGVIQTDYLGSGMWCDPSYGFKVMEVVMTEPEVEDDEDPSDDHSYHIELYSYNSNSWKKLECQEFSDIGNTGVCINGVFYSRATRKGVEHSEILSFDFSTETLSTIPFPTNRSSFYSYHLEYKGLFTLFARSATDLSATKEYEFWVMNKDGSWMRESVFHACGVGQPLWFSQYGKLLYFSTLDNELVVFDRGNGKLKHLGIYMFGLKLKQLIPVVESFVPLHRMLDVEGQEKREEDEDDDKDIIEVMDGPLVQV